MAKTGKKNGSSNAADLGFEQKLWTAANELRGHKHIVLGLIFLKYISHAFEESTLHCSKMPTRLKG